LIAFTFVLNAIVLLFARWSLLGGGEGGGGGLLGGRVHAAVPRISAVGPGLSLTIGVVILELDAVANFLRFLVLIPQNKRDMSGDFRGHFWVFWGGGIEVLLGASRVLVYEAGMVST
jgi:hypothetical protein